MRTYIDINIHTNHQCAGWGRENGQCAEWTRAARKTKCAEKREPAVKRVNIYIYIYIYKRQNRSHTLTYKQQLIQMLILNAACPVHTLGSKRQICFSALRTCSSSPSLWTMQMIDTVPSSSIRSNALKLWSFSRSCRFGNTYTEHIPTNNRMGAK